MTWTFSGLSNTMKQIMNILNTWQRKELVFIISLLVASVFTSIPRGAFIIPILQTKKQLPKSQTNMSHQDNWKYLFVLSSTGSQELEIKFTVQYILPHLFSSPPFSEGITEILLLYVWYKLILSKQTNKRVCSEILFHLKKQRIISTSLYNSCL